MKIITFGRTDMNGSCIFKIIRFLQNKTRGPSRAI